MLGASEKLVSARKSIWNRTGARTNILCCALMYVTSVSDTSKISESWSGPRRVVASTALSVAAGKIVFDSGSAAAGKESPKPGSQRQHVAKQCKASTRRRSVLKSLQRPQPTTSRLLRRTAKTQPKTTQRLNTPRCARLTVQAWLGTPKGSRMASTMQPKPHTSVAFSHRAYN